MNKLLLIFVGMLLILVACEKHNYLKDVEGDYTGFYIVTSWTEQTSWVFDSTQAKVSLCKSAFSSKVNLFIETEVITYDYKFKFINGGFESTEKYGHVPNLEIRNDSLFFSYKPGLGPIVFGCVAKKN